LRTFVSLQNQRIPDHLASIAGSSRYRRGSLPGNVINDRTDTSHIGANWANTAQRFDGDIDWVNWGSVADYSGVDQDPT